MHTHWNVSSAVIAALTVGGLVAIADAKPAKPEYVLVGAGTSKFAPLDPKNPGGIQISVLSGDIKTGPAAFLLKLPKGPAPIHWHSSDYYAWTVEGKSKHWLPGTEADAKENGPGTFWFQPGGATGAHGDECLTDSCTVYIFMPGKFDFTPVAAKAAPPAKK
jgi:hypothetical protein